MEKTISYHTLLGKGLLIHARIVYVPGRSMDSSYLRQLVPRWTRTLDNSYSRQLVLKAACAQDISYPSGW